jgi:hypothetical protein
MRHLLAASLLLAAAVPAAAQTVETATGDWSAIPEMRRQNGASIEVDAIAAISEAMERGECVISGQRRRNVDVNMPFLVLFNANGAVDRLVIQPLGCPRAEGLFAGAVLRMVQRGAFTPTGQRRHGWFRGEIGFAISNS